MNSFVCKVCANGVQIPLLEYYSKRFTYQTYDIWKETLKQGRISVNGVVVTVDCTLFLNDEIEYTPPPFEEPPANLAYTIIYEDDWIIGVDKPGNLLVHRNGRSVTNNLIYQLTSGAGKKFPNAGLIHRLDRETSGVIIVAKHPTSLAPFQKLFIEGSVHKEYLAIVRNHLKADIFVVSQPIGKDLDSAIPYKHRVDTLHGKASETTFCRIRNCSGNKCFVKAVPKTGRTHQIRVHSAFSGHPICGDRLYALSESDYLEKNFQTLKDDEILRQALHCNSIAFDHPFLKKEIIIETELPTDMQKLVSE